MRKYTLLSIALVIGLAAGCSGGAAPTPSPSPSPSPLPPSPTPTSNGETPESATSTSAPPPTPTPSGPATCETFTLPVESRIPDVTEDDHVLGPDDAPITFIEYADFQCPSCAQLHTLRDNLRSAYGDQIRFVYRHLPLVSMHDKALVTAEAAEAAAAQGKFWEMHDLLYERKDEWGNTPKGEELKAKLVEYAEELDLDTDRFSQALEDEIYREEIMADLEAYEEYGRMATPTYVINKVPYPTQQLGGFGKLAPFIELIRSRDQMYSSPPAQVIDPDKDYKATIRTSKGDIVVDLLEDKAPVNVNSFAFLAQEGWYDEQDIFVNADTWALSGDPTNTGGGIGLPFSGFHCDSEITSTLSFDEEGIVALVPSLYSSKPGQTSNTFIITFAPQSDFNNQLTIIGKVIEGLDIAKSLTVAEEGAEQPEFDSIETILIEEQ